MQARTALDGIQNLTYPKDYHELIYNPESSVLEHWLELADVALAMSPAAAPQLHKRRLTRRAA